MFLKITLIKKDAQRGATNEIQFSLNGQASGKTKNKKKKETIFLKCV